MERLEIQVEDSRIPVTVSVGCTLIVPRQNDLDLAHDLLASADAAMYEAKKQGRNQVVLRSMREESEGSLMQRPMDRAISRSLAVHDILPSKIIEELLAERFPWEALADDADLPEEVFTTLHEAPNIRIERIISRGHASPEGFWYDQPQHEWVILLHGAARLRFEDEEIELELGDFVNIPAHKKHRVEWTASEGPTIWLAVHYG